MDSCLWNADRTFLLLHDVIGARSYPGYEWMKQAVSDLTAADAPSFVVASGFMTVYKIFSCVCSVFLCVMVSDEHKISDVRSLS